MVPFSSTSFSRARSINSGFNGRRDEHTDHASVPSAREVPQTLQVRAPLVLTPGDRYPKQSLLRTSCQFLGRRQNSAAHLVSCLASYALSNFTWALKTPEQNSPLWRRVSQQFVKARILAQGIPQWVPFQLAVVDPARNRG